MLIGYMRISTDKQDHSLQLDALKSAGCHRIFEETMSGGRDDRPRLQEAIAFAREGDILVVWRLDRLGRSLSHLMSCVKEIEQRKVGFRSLTESIDTTSASGRLVFHFFAAIAEFERDLIRTRTNAGLEAARARGRIGGRPPKMTEESIRHAQKLLEGSSASTVSRLLGVSRATLYRHLEKVQIR